MLSLAPYSHTPSRLEDFLPWGFLVAPGVILNKDGSFQKSARFRGPDVRSATPEELISFTARANNVFKRLGSGWALYIEAERSEIRDYPTGDFADDASRLVDAERAAQFEQAGAQFETIHHITLQWAPPADATRRASAFFFEIDQANDEGEPTKKKDRAERIVAAKAADTRFAKEALEHFERTASWALGLFEGLTVDFHALGDDETLTYLKRTISPKPHKVRAPASAAFLDGLLCDAALVGGAAPVLGGKHLRVLTIKGFPSFTAPGILDDLNALGISYRWMTRFLCLDRTEAEKELVKWRRLWFSKHKSLAALFKEMLTKEAAALPNPDALAKTAEVDAALLELGAEAVGFGYLTATLVVLGETAVDADEKLRLAERVINARGFVTVTETLNAVEAWLSSIPGQAYANVRHPIVSTLNLAHVAPLATSWAGEDWNRHLGAPPLILARTDGSTPFRLDLFVGDVGHTLVVGPTGAGKSVLLSLLALQWRRYRQAQVFIFDKGGSARAAVRAMGGEAIDLGASDAPAFQPLARIDDAHERSIALDWVMGLLAQEEAATSPELKEKIWAALTSLGTAPPSQRHLTGLRLLVQDAHAQAALLPYTQDGAHGAIFDGAEERLQLSDILLFEMEEIMGRPKAAAPALLHLFHRLEEMFDGKPTLLILDEAWVFLDSPLFAARIREWLKTLRKKNVAVVFATQSLADIANSAIAPALVESCPTRIYLPNERAFEPQQRRAYEQFGLNETEIELIATAQRKRDYYYASPKGRRVFDLALGPVALAFCAASDPASRALITQLEKANTPRTKFWKLLLAARRLDWVLEALGETVSEPVTSNEPTSALILEEVP
jgi:type IV secretion system protein VirB4